MNYQDSLDDMSTLAHEFGHALHSDLAMKAQPYSSFRYPAVSGGGRLDLQRVAAFGLPGDQGDRPGGKGLRFWSSGSNDPHHDFPPDHVRGVRTPVHGFVEEGTPITAALLEETYSDLVQRYYGPGYTFDANDGMEWAYIPHFYYKYYVYSYATGLSSGIAIADRVKTLGQASGRRLPRHAGRRRLGATA